MDMLSLSPRAIAEYLENALQAPPKYWRPTAIKGTPGGGKTSVIRQVCQKINLPCWIVRPIQHESVEFTGLPVQVNGTAAWAPFGNLLPTDPAWDGVIFLDEVTQLDSSGQKIIASLLDKSGVAGSRIPSGARFILAGNRQQDRAGASRLLSLVESRCVQLEMSFSLDDWQRWAASEDVHPIVRSYADFAGSKFVPAFDASETVHATPRTWEMVSDQLHSCPSASTSKDDPMLTAVISGIVGASHASQFMAFREHYAILNGVVDQILADPSQAKIDRNDLSVVHAVIGCVTERVRQDNGKLTDRQLGNVVTLANGFTDVLSCLLFVNIHAFAPQSTARLLNTKEGQGWIAKHAAALSASRRVR